MVLRIIVGILAIIVGMFEFLNSIISYYFIDYYTSVIGLKGWISLCCLSPVLIASGIFLITSNKKYVISLNFHILGSIIDSLIVGVLYSSYIHVFNWLLPILFSLIFGTYLFYNKNLNILSLDFYKNNFIFLIAIIFIILFPKIIL